MDRGEIMEEIGREGEGGRTKGGKVMHDLLFLKAL